MSAQVSSRSGAYISGALAPLRIRRFGQVGARRDAHQALERPEQGMALRNVLRFCLHGGVLQMARPLLRRADAAKDELAGLDIDLLGLEASVEPNLGHYVVPGIIAPPRAMVLRGRQLSSNKPLDFRERHLDFG